MASRGTPTGTARPGTSVIPPLYEKLHYDRLLPGVEDSFVVPEQGNRRFNVLMLKDVEAIASLPSKEELISKVMFLLNAQAQRLVTVLSAVPRNLAIVVKQIGDQRSGETA